jgi:dienelactone hydrolase
MFPDWQGCLTESSDRLAKLYGETCDAEVIVTDLFGASRRPDDYSDADRVMSSALANLGDTRSALRSIFESLNAFWTTSGPLFIVGFCFGGSLAFEMGRSGAVCRGVVSIHGQPDSRLPLNTPDRPGAAFMMLHGSEDPFISGASLNAFGAEMRNIGADWSLYIFGGAKHSFTRADIGVGNHAMGYSPKADREAVCAVCAFIDRLSPSEENAGVPLVAITSGSSNARDQSR